MFRWHAPDPRPARPSIRIPAFGFLKAAFSPVFSCFFAKNTPRVAARAIAQRKNPARHAARLPA
jgi:hypothetical protein